jgi:hypothetical protein
MVLAVPGRGCRSHPKTSSGWREISWHHGSQVAALSSIIVPMGPGRNRGKHVSYGRNTSIFVHMDEGPAMCPEKTVWREQVWFLAGTAKGKPLWPVGYFNRYAVVHGGVNRLRRCPFRPF